MASTAQIYGQIGAAKAFSSSVSNSLDIDTEWNEKEIRELEEELEQTTDEKQRKKIKKRIKRLKRRNKMNKAQGKFAQSVTDFLTKIAAYMDIGITTLIKWIANIIVAVLPALEVSIKMLLLTNIKKMLSCAIDPRIPDEWRTTGVLLNEAFVDPRCILKSSPYSKYGKYMYFGCHYDKKYQDPKPTHSLARAEDMNAFLWYAKNCAKFVSANIIEPNDMGVKFADGAGSTFYNKHEFKGLDAYRYVEGSTFKQCAESNTTFLCEKREFRGNDVYYTIVPATDVWTGITWYKDRTSLTGLEKSKKINYDKSKPLFNIEYLGTYGDAPFYHDGNFRFRILPKPFSTAGGFFVDLENNMNVLSDMADSSYITELAGSELTESNIENNGLNYQFSGIQSPIPYVARFNAEGNYDRKGKYSIDTRQYQVIEKANYSQKQHKDDPTNCPYQIQYYISRYDNPDNPVARLVFDKTYKRFTIMSASSYTHEADDKLKAKVLSECYGGNTVYEFNYDYVVSMKLFDAKSIAAGIVDAILNINLPNPFKRGRNEDESSEATTNIDQMRIDAHVDRLVEKMIESEDYEFTDCFYTFSNEDYEKMEQDVADKVANSTLITETGENSINEIYDIISQYDADATLHEQEEVITLALTKAAISCGFSDAGGNGTDTSGGSQGTNVQSYQTPGGNNKSLETFIKQAVQFLVGAIVNSILTPKVLMLLQVNRMMMGTDALPTSKDWLKNNYKYDVEDVLNGLSGLLKGVIRQVIDTIQRELLKLILQRLSEMMAGYLKKLGLEYAMKWALLLKQLLACFKRNRTKMSGGGRGYGNDRVGASKYDDVINNIIDQVDYADIDALVDEIIPNTNPC